VDNLRRELQVLEREGREQQAMRDAFDVERVFLSTMMCQDLGEAWQRRQEEHTQQRAEMLTEMLRDMLSVSGHEHVPLPSVRPPPCTAGRAAFGGDDCPICRSAYDGECNRAVLPCGHALHTTCVLQWAKHCTDGFTYPTCRVTCHET
jgi:hypothetical protein